MSQVPQVIQYGLLTRTDLSVLNLIKPKPEPIQAELDFDDSKSIIIILNNEFIALKQSQRCK